jgi:DNA repair ATPase RecN
MHPDDVQALRDELRYLNEESLLLRAENLIWTKAHQKLFGELCDNLTRARRQGDEELEKEVMEQLQDFCFNEELVRRAAGR